MQPKSALWAACHMMGQIYWSPNECSSHGSRIRMPKEEGNEKEWAGGALNQKKKWWSTFFSQRRELLPAKLQNWWYSVRAIVISREEGSFGIETSWERGHSLDLFCSPAFFICSPCILLSHTWKHWLNKFDEESLERKKKYLLPEA